jgi:hypothetical protein
MLSTSAVSGALQSAFRFQVVTIGAPPPIFGDVLATSPPGLICQIGEIELASGVVVPIRALMFDARRAIIDIAGPSEAIDAVWQQLQVVLSTHVAPDGQPILGQPTATADQSEIAFDAELPRQLGIDRRILNVIEARMPEGRTLVPSLVLRANAGDLFPSSPVAAFLFEPRGGSPLSSNHWFSSAPLQTEAHSDYLEDFIAVLASSP